MGTPYHAKKKSDGAAKPIVTAGFTPGGHIASGYSYLQRSHSLVTSTRRNVPQGLESPSTGKQAGFVSPSPSPSPSHAPTNWLQRSSSSNSLTDSLSSPRLAKKDLESQSIITLVAQLPPNPKTWTPSQVALYLTHVLGLTPKPVVQDVTNYVRSSGMGGKIFMRLSVKDLEAEGLNLKWRKLMMEAVKKLRRDCLRGRMWGYEGGLPLPWQEDDGVVDEANGVDDDYSPKRVPVTAMGTLKRLRDKKAIRAMISTFENANQELEVEDDTPATTVGKLHQRRGSLASLHVSESSDHLHRAPLPPIYGKGFVKSRAESYTSLNDLSSQTNRKDFTKDELEHWFGSLSDQEAEALASELQEDEELHHHHSGNASYSSHSSVSGESEALTPPPIERAGFDLTPLDAELIEAIVGQPLRPEALIDAGADHRCVEPLHRDFLIDDEETIIFEQSESLALLRSELARSGKLNLYRGSTYEEEGMVALGMDIDDGDSVRHSTARKISRPASDELQEQVADVQAAQDSIHVRKADNSTPLARDIFVSSEKEPMDHMRHMSALEACGLSPYKAVSPAMSRKPSQKRHGEGEKSMTVDAPDSRESSKVTLGRKAGTGNLSILLAGGLFDDYTCASDEGKKAEDERDWGTTVSRKASRRNTLANSTARQQGAAPNRIADLFTPVPQDELSADNLKELELTSVDKEHLFVPMSTIEPSEDGKSVTRKKSMVLVERKKFEALARRMGVLESQLAQLEAASLPSLSNLDSMSDRGRSCRVLDEIFTIPVLPLSPQHINNNGDEEEHSMPKPNSDDYTTRFWSFPALLGAVPSYGEHLGKSIAAF